MPHARCLPLVPKARAAAKRLKLHGAAHVAAGHHRRAPCHVHQGTWCNLGDGHVRSSGAPAQAGACQSRTRWHMPTATVARPRFAASRCGTCGTRYSCSVVASGFGTTPRGDNMRSDRCGHARQQSRRVRYVHTRCCTRMSRTACTQSHRHPCCASSEAQQQHTWRASTYALRWRTAGSMHASRTCGNARVAAGCWPHTPDAAGRGDSRSVSRR